MVLGVRLQVLGELPDTCCVKRDLDLGRSRVPVCPLVLRDQLAFDFVLYCQTQQGSIRGSLCRAFCSWTPPGCPDCPGLLLGGRSDSPDYPAFALVARSDSPDYPAFALVARSDSPDYPALTFGARSVRPDYPTCSTLPSDRGSAPARHFLGPSTTIAWACPNEWCLAGMSLTRLSARAMAPAPG